MTTMTTAAAGERLHALDSLRTVTMLLAILLHTGMSFLTIDVVPWLAHDVRAGRGFDVLVGLLSCFPLQVFFFLAGFFGHLLWKRLGTRGFLVQRGKRIGIPFVAGLVVIIPLIIVIWTWADARFGTTFVRDREGERSPLAIPTAHLWFLEMLLILYAIAMALAPLRHRAWMQAQLPRIDAAFDALVRMPFKPVLLALPTVALLWTGPRIPQIDMAGQRLLPAPAAVAYYALFFGMGWWMRRRMHLLGELRRWIAPYLLASLVCFLAMGEAMSASMAPDARLHATPIKAVALVAAALYSWCMTFAVTGLFLKFVGGHRPWMRYMADASYWWYLCHLPIVMVMQVLLARSPINGLVKLLAILAVAVVVLLPTYHWCVRYTWVGRIMNGPRERGLSKSLPAPG